ncbi:cobalt ABC transporter, permease protein CbiQ [Desulfosporosinus acidiphilus SJ4]|uniref:Cobalt ABC transporter, permease protein CbiQ n=1 Tax=Desulfosporosinus acidiphilus (strain DSM 22704 / JCM 16185 / SJ4) TaxID=646529 RepID=I4D0F8_DESAJ|nr:cobalt ECF transporter T component CbiQ [Desulfosporosinus acidiphilus]AFM39282.1 cobalt ABC transporter, permease protein CbiQ [Desulfosporosinus acidiphilus SJ4]
MELPSWLSEMSPALCRCGCGGRRKGNFIEKTLRDIVRIIQDAVFSEEIARRPGLLQSLDSRVKVTALIYLLVVVNLCSHLSLLWGFYFVLLAVAVVSRLPLRQVVVRVWLVIPLFTGIMVLPSLFNWVRPGEPLWVIANFHHPLHLGFLAFPSTLSVTRQGLWGGIMLVSRVGISVSLAVILTLSTRWMDFLRALRAFFVPKIFIMTLEMTYRYIFVLVTAMEEMFLARKARDAGQSAPKEERRFVASAVGGLFGKSLQMSEEVYWAMTARGYSGEIRLLQSSRLNWRDAIILLLVILAGLILIAANQVMGG